MTILLNNDDVVSLLTMGECIDALDEAFGDLGRGEGAFRDRLELIGPTQEVGDFYSLKSVDGLLPNKGVSTLRVVSDVKEIFEVDGRVRRRKIPAAPGERYTGLAIVFSIETGEPLMIFTDGVVNPLRVAATSALGIRHMARKDARRLAILGTGRQARRQIEAAVAVRDLSEVRCFSPSSDSRTAFARAVSDEFGVNAMAMESAEEAVRGADIVLSATNSRSPVYQAAWLEPGQHLSGITAREMDPAAVRAADIAVCLSNTGESHYVATHGLTEEQVSGPPNDFVEEAGLAVLPTIADIAAGTIKGRDNDQQITCFANTIGIGFQWAVVGALLYEKARAAGCGNEIPTDWLTQAKMS
jgi:ornithine cyclodeaminase/alanine dehydrogenase-like protein (mu-crystallin family)